MTVEDDVKNLMYKKLDDQPSYSQVANDLGKAMKTMTDLIFDTQYDPVESAAMDLPAGVRGYAWKRPDGSYIYSLWARTTEDLSEAASATYSFPATFNASSWKRYDWKYGYTNEASLVSGQNILLDARPVFFTVESVEPLCQLQASITDVKCRNNTTADPGDDIYSATLTVHGDNAASSWTTVINGQELSGTFGTPVVLGPYPIAAGSLSFLIQDVDNARCTTTALLTPPAPCSSGTAPGNPCASLSNFPWHDWIARVQLAGLDNSSGKTAYSDFSGLSTNLERGTLTDITLTAGFSWEGFQEYWKVWIDYDQDGVFEEPAEVAYAGLQPQPANGAHTVKLNGQLTVPLNALPGAARMRVSMSHSEEPAPCQTLSTGEVEDYTVHILPGVFSVVPKAGNAHKRLDPKPLHLFPNPAKDYVTIDLRPYLGQEGRLRVYNAQGHCVTDLALTAGLPALLPLSLAGYTSGSYVVQVQAGGNTVAGKMTVIR